MRLPPGGVPTSYPSTKMPILDNPALFEKLDTEALFFAFYYQPGTYQQWLAARELKRQSWRYHKQHGAWFQVGEASRGLHCTWGWEAWQNGWALTSTVRPDPRWALL